MYDRLAIDEARGRLVDKDDEERLVRALWEAMEAKEKGKRQMTIGHRKGYGVMLLSGRIDRCLRRHLAPMEQADSKANGSKAACFYGDQHGLSTGKKSTVAG